MNKFIIPIICLLISIGSFVLVAIVSGQDIYKDADNETKCNTHTVAGKNCSIWDNNTCYKGIISGGNCVKNTNLLGLVGLVVSIVFFIMFIVTLIMALRKRK
jgi:hypothetical protein